MRRRTCPAPTNGNDKVIVEFRANEGRVGGTFERAPITLVHHRGRKSGREYITPMLYLGDESDADAIDVFATNGGAPTNADRYCNLVSASNATIERGTETYGVVVREFAGAGGERIYDEQARRYPGSADYTKATAGIRTIPVLDLRRAAG